jgi:CheY-like chemotaxis protein
MEASGAFGVILLVEDEWLVRAAIADALRVAGWGVLETSSGEDAIVALRSGEQIDLIFTDIRLAGAISGWDVAELGRASQAGLPVIYASGDSVDRSRRVQDSLFFGKPYDLVKVVEACRRLLRK